MSETGMPLLSGPPRSIEIPRSNSNACRKCNKEFNVFMFSRSRKCQHCGFHYCATCSDFQALMPRLGSMGETGGSGAGAQSGYDVVNVCAFCIEYLQITAGGKSYLKSLPLAKLRKYASAYNITIDHAVEKDDVIEAIINAKGPNGCLGPEKETFYRKYSVPDRTAGGAARPRGIFSRPSPNTFSSSRTSDNLPPRPPPQHTRPEFARPDLEPDHPNPPPPQQEQQQQQQHSQQEYHHHNFQQAPHPPPPQPNLPHYNAYNSNSHPHYQPHYHTPPPAPPPPPPPPHPEYHWGRPPYAHNSFYSTWGYPPEPDYYNYGGQSTYHHAHAHSHPNYTSFPYPPSGPPPTPPTNSRPAPPPPHFHTHPHMTPSTPPPAPPRPPPHRPSSPPQQSQPAPSSPPRPQQAQPAPNSPPRTQAQPMPTSTSARSSTQASQPPQPPRNSPPNLDDLLSMEPTSIRGLSISNLKSVLFANHVNVNATMVLEKSDLVSRVIQLVEDEKREREHARMANEEEEERLMQIIREQNAKKEKANRESTETKDREDNERRKREEMVEDESTEGTSTSSSPPPASKKPFSERSGLCVICQDEESNIVIVDCGHLAMCRTCSDLIMSTSRECPLCRTRIVTESRLLRIFKS